MKCGGNGTWQTALYLDDGDGLTPSQGDKNGDYLFVFSFTPSNDSCLLYTSDAADERSSVDLGGRRIIKKKKSCSLRYCAMMKATY